MALSAIDTALWDLKARILNAPLVTILGAARPAIRVYGLGEYLRKLRALFDRYDYGCDLYGHFAQGCVHTRIDFDLETAAGIRKFRAFLHDAAKLVTSLGGSISGEHGDGQSKAELLPIMFGPELVEAFRAFKRIWDPDNKMNPGKIVDAYRADENLRLGTSYNPPSMSTHFRYEQDGGNFSRTLLRCLGVGECRKKSGTPAVRGATEETLLIATGFSCREQIRQTTGRRTMHPAEVVELAFSA
jgi:hypothetical protein